MFVRKYEFKNCIHLGSKWGIRHVQALLIFLNIVVVYISRLNIGVAVVAMTNAATTNPDYPVSIGTRVIHIFVAYVRQV